MKLSNKIFLSLLIPACASSLHAWYIIFDLPKTLMDVNEFSFFKSEIGASGIWYTLTFNNPKNLKEKTFNTLSEIGTQECAAEHFVRDPEGDLLPQVYCDFLLGKPDTFKRSKQHVRTNLKKNRERDLIESIAKAIFDPEKLAQHAEVVKHGLQLVQDCKNRHGQDQLYIMSNLNVASLQELYKAKHMQPLLKHFTPQTNIFISEKMKTLLPNPACFESLTKRNYNLNECVFISSMPWNVQSARQAGLRAVLVKDGDFKTAREELKALGVL